MRLERVGMSAMTALQPKERSGIRQPTTHGGVWYI